MKKNITISAFLFLLSTICYSQEAIISAGDYHKKPAISVSWTLGEIMTETFEAGGTILTQGFQQPHIIIESYVEHTELDFEITAFPIPAKEFINVKISTDDFKNLSYELYDIKGHVIERNKFNNNIMQISLQDMDAAVYFIRVYDNKSVLKIFKIIKH